MLLHNSKKAHFGPWKFQNMYLNKPRNNERHILPLATYRKDTFVLSQNSVSVIKM